MLALMVVVAAGGIAVATKGDVPANLLALLQTLFGGYVGGNIGEHWAKNISAGKGGVVPGASAVPASAGEEHFAVLDRVAGVEAKVDTQTELLMAVGQSVQAVNEILANARAKKP